MAKKSRKKRDWDKIVKGLLRDLNMYSPGRYYHSWVAMATIESTETGKDLGGMDLGSGELTGESFQGAVAGHYEDIAQSLNGRLDSMTITQIHMFPVYEILEERYDPEEDEYVFSPPKVLVGPGGGDAWNADYDADPIWSWSLAGHTQAVARGDDTYPLVYGVNISGPPEWYVPYGAGGD